MRSMRPTTVTSPTFTSKNSSVCSTWGTGVRRNASQKISQLLHSLRLIEVVLVAVLHTGLGEIVAEELDQRRRRPWGAPARTES